MGLLYIKGPSEEVRRTFRVHRVDSFFKYSNIPCQLLCSLKDPAKKEEISRVIYEINCEVIGKDMVAGVHTFRKLAGHSRLGSQNISDLAPGPQRCRNTCTSRGKRNSGSP